VKYPRGTSVQARPYRDALTDRERACYAARSPIGARMQLLGYNASEVGRMDGGRLCGRDPTPRRAEAKRWHAQLAQDIQSVARARGYIE